MFTSRQVLKREHLTPAREQTLHTISTAETMHSSTMTQVKIDVHLKTKVTLLLLIEFWIWGFKLVVLLFLFGTDWCCLLLFLVSWKVHSHFKWNLTSQHSLYESLFLSVTSGAEYGSSSYALWSSQMIFCVIHL